MGKVLKPKDVEKVIRDNPAHVFERSPFVPISCRYCGQEERFHVVSKKQPHKAKLMTLDDLEAIAQDVEVPDEPSAKSSKTPAVDPSDPEASYNAAVDIMFDTVVTLDDILKRKHMTKLDFRNLKKLSDKMWQFLLDQGEVTD